MKSIKLMFIAVEIAALYGVMYLAFSPEALSSEPFIKGMYITMFALLAVAMQKEHQAIEWNDSEEEEKYEKNY